MEYNNYYNYYIHVCTRLITMAVCVLQEGYTALANASDCGHLTVVQTLLDAGADVRAQDYVSESSGTFCGLISMSA